MLSVNEPTIDTALPLSYSHLTVLPSKSGVKSTVKLETKQSGDSIESACAHMAPSLHTPTDPKNWAWRRKISFEDCGHWNADPCHTVSPPPTVVHWKVMLWFGQMQISNNLKPFPTKFKRWNMDIQYLVKIIWFTRQFTCRELEQSSDKYKSCQNL